MAENEGEDKRKDPAQAGAGTRTRRKTAPSNQKVGRPAAQVQRMVEKLAPAGEESTSIYAGPLLQRELLDYERYRAAEPDEEIVMLRMVIRRMLYLMNEAKSFQEIIQTLNTLGYITGRLSKLFEVKLQQAKSEGKPNELEEMMNLSIQEILEMWEKEENTEMLTE